MLYIVATPIGNLEDITLRALRILGEVDFVLAEDTRKTGFLLKHFNLKKKLVSFFDHNEAKKTPGVIKELLSGQKAALVSSAGTPTISDPGYCLVNECIKNDIDIKIIPGPSSLVSALALSGLPSDKFLFLGFLPRKKGKSIKVLQEAAQYKHSLIIFESPYRVKKTLGQLAEVFSGKEVALVREITKVHEQVIRGEVGEVISQLEDKNIKGECVLVVDNSF